MVNIVNQLSLAISSLQDNKLRSVLSMFGITIGIAAVIVVNSISIGGKALIFSELETFGLKTIWVFRDNSNKNPHTNLRKGSGIDTYDYKFLKSECCDYLSAITPVVNFKELKTIHNKNKYIDANALGVDISFFNIENDKLDYGRFFIDREITSSSPVAVIGHNAAKKLFGRTNLLGKEFYIGLTKITLIGTLKRKNRELLNSIGAGGEDINERIYLPYTLVQKINGNRNIDYLQAKTTMLNKTETVSNNIKNLLERRHKKIYKYKSQSMSGYIDVANNILRNVSIIGIIAASISLLVGGMGIMNIMSISVIERTREIGVRKV